MTSPLPDAGLEDRDAGLCARPCFKVDVAQGLIVEGNAGAWAALGLAATAAPPVAVDRAMPALQQLARLACARHMRSSEILTFWTPAGVKRLHCAVRRLQAEQGVFLVEVIDAAPPATEASALNGAAGAHPGDVSAAAKLAHELRTPLAAVIAYAEVLKEEHFGALGNGRYREYARNIYDSARHALGVVDGMLAHAPASSGLPELAFADLDPAGIVENCLAVARPLAERAGLELVAEAVPPMPRIVADEVALKQMLLNLLTNAIKFGRPGDRVAVEVAHDLGGPLRISVADTGPGMAEPPLALEGGKAANGRHKARNAGHGIGLPLTRALAEANGATLVIDSAPGRGTRITIVFGKDRVVPV